MGSDYFTRLTESTGTRFWINNPSRDELDLAVANGAVSCTTNPAYCAKLLKSDPEYLHRMIDESIGARAGIDETGEAVYREAVARIMKRLAPIFRGSGGASGYVTMQEDPRFDQDTGMVMDRVLGNRRLGPNYMAKIPVIAGGMEAIEACVEENIPICATEVFAIDQAVSVCERYETASRRTGNSPPFFVTHISGIFDEYLEKLASREKIPVQQQSLRLAGLSLAWKEHELLKRRGYRAVLLGGGARGLHHFTGMAGLDAHVTINWSTAREILETGIEPSAVMDRADLPRATAELKEKFPDYAKAFEEGGLAEREYAEFGPVQLFRNAFLSGWHTLLAEVAARKQRYAL